MALPDITSGPEVCQILKIQTVWKPDVFHPRRRTFNTFENIFSIFFSLKIFLSNFFSRLFFYLFIWTSNFWHEICVQGPYLTRIDNLWLACKMFKSISPDSVWSGRTCLAGPVWQDLSGRTCLAGSVWQVWVSSPVRSGNSCAKSSRALPWVINTQVIKYRHRGGQT